MTDATRELKAIFFDVDDTLFSTSEFAQRARENSIDSMIAYGLRMDRQACLKELEEVIQEFSSNYEQHYDKLLCRIPREAYQGINPAILIAAAVVSYHQTKFEELQVYPDVPKAFERLSRTPLLLGIITAGLTIKQAEKIVRLKIYPYLDPAAIFVSDQIGISKPNKKLYEKACEASGIPPRCAMYVGDNPANDVDPTKELGMIAVLSRRPGARHANVTGRYQPDHVIHDFNELLSLIENVYGIEVPS